MDLLRSRPQPATGENIVGAIVFFTYIFAALAFTGFIVTDILYLSGQRKQDAPNLRKSSRKRDAKISRGVRRTIVPLCALTAFISFSVLSWNMLLFLVESYKTWAARRSLPLIVPRYDALGIRTQAWFIWSWATDSSLFQQFAEDLLLDPATWENARVALLYSYAWNLWMSMAGWRRNIPHLWMYFVLDQILPVSFTQNLFLTATTLAPESQTTVRSLRPFLLLRIAALACYVLLLYIMPATLLTNWFVFVLFTVRMLLFAPYLIDLVACVRRSNESNNENQIWMINRWCLIALAAFGVLSVLKEPAVNQSYQEKPHMNYAAAALSNDLSIAIASGLLYACAQRIQ